MKVARLPEQPLGMLEERVQDALLLLGHQGARGEKGSQNLLDLAHRGLRPEHVQVNTPEAVGRGGGLR